jgi:hypothetical protein
MPTGDLTMGGRSNSFANQIIVYQASFSGNSSLTVNYDGRNPVASNNAFLVRDPNFDSGGTAGAP